MGIQEAKETRRLVVGGNFSQQQAEARANAFFMQSIPPLFVLVGLVGGFVGSLLANAVSYFIGAEDKRPWVQDNLGWTVVVLACVPLVLYVAWWADRMAQLYRARGAGVAFGAGLRMH